MSTVINPNMYSAVPLSCSGESHQALVNITMPKIIWTAAINVARSMPLLSLAVLSLDIVSSLDLPSDLKPTDTSLAA